MGKLVLNLIYLFCSFYFPEIRLLKTVIFHLLNLLKTDLAVWTGISLITFCFLDILFSLSLNSYLTKDFEDEISDTILKNLEMYCIICQHSRYAMFCVGGFFVCFGFVGGKPHSSSQCLQGRHRAFRCYSCGECCTDTNRSD